MKDYTESSQSLTGYISDCELQIFKLKFCIIVYSLSIIATSLITHFFVNGKSAGTVLCVFFSAIFAIVGFASLIAPSPRYDISDSGITAIFSRKRSRYVAWNNIGNVFTITYWIPVTSYTQIEIDCYAIFPEDEAFPDEKHFKHYDERKYVRDNLQIVLLPKNVVVESFLEKKFDVSKIIDMRH